jgi:hypothetical protein
VAAFALGLRSGADGGPDRDRGRRHPPRAARADLAPLGDAAPGGQRLRAAAFALALGGAVLGQLIATEVEGSRTAWAAACGAFGAIVGVTFVSTAVIAHTLRVPRWLATASPSWPSPGRERSPGASGTTRRPASPASRPGNLAGRLALWGISQRADRRHRDRGRRRHGGAALALGGRLRVEALARRGELVSQLRFAATVQDLRTVVQLRRQLRSEILRTRPWGQRRHPRRPHRAPPLVPARRRRRPPEHPSPFVVWRRDSRSLRRLPRRTVVRIALLAAIGGVGVR